MCDDRLLLTRLLALCALAAGIIYLRLEAAECREAAPLKFPPNGTRRPRYPIRGSKAAFTVTKKTYLRKEWCKTELLKQVIREKGCLKRKVLNRFCYGQCNSFFIPRGQKTKAAAAFMSCAFCKPRRFTWVRVTLRCPGKPLRFKRRKIRRIKRCKCVAQSVDSNS